MYTYTHRNFTKTSNLAYQANFAATISSINTHEEEQRLWTTPLLPQPDLQSILPLALDLQSHSHAKPTAAFYTLRSLGRGVSEDEPKLGMRNYTLSSAFKTSTLMDVSESRSSLSILINIPESFCFALLPCSFGTVWSCSSRFLLLPTEGKQSTSSS